MFSSLERYLRIDRFTTKSKLMRARAVYMMGLAFIATQMINLAAMYYSYGGFTFDHTVSITVCLLVALTIAFLRRSDKFQIYALIFSVLIIGATMTSALNQNTGINSALIPFFILGVIVNGFICGWRATLTFGTVVLASIWYLWWVSSAYSYTPIFDVENFADRNFQRAIQASLATIVISMIGAFFSKNMHEAFADLESAVAMAQASDRAKTDFLATMSHELFTPMNGIIGMNNVLEDTKLDAEQRELTEVIGSSGRDLKAIIGNVLLFSQLESQRIVLDSAPFELRATLLEALRPYAKKATQKGLNFKASVPEATPDHIFGDRARTIQILGALLDNAIKFTASGTVELSLTYRRIEAEHIELKITVSDTGIGIAPEDRDRIFERFTQKDGSIKRAYGGTGLGLTIVQGLVDLMGGTIGVDGEEGMGTRITICAPFGIASGGFAAPILEAAE